jgi:hypothetical protein
VNFDSWSAYAQQNRLCRSGRCSFQAQLIGNRLLDNGILEEARVVARVQHGGIGERELAKILFGDEALLNHLERIGYDIREVGDVKVREVGAEHRPACISAARLLIVTAPLACRFFIIASSPSGQTARGLTLASQDFIAEQ